MGWKVGNAVRMAKFCAERRVVSAEAEVVLQSPRCVFGMAS